MDLGEFLSQANAKLATYTELTSAGFEDFLEWLRDTLKPFYIRYSYEPPSNIEEINRLKAKYPGVNIPRRIRFTLKSDRNQSDFKQELCRLANGIVFVIEEPKLSTLKQVGDNDHGNADTKIKARVLCIPSNDFGPIAKTEDMNKLIKNNAYKVYDIKDGTIVNLYYDDAYIYENKELKKGRWLIGSKNNHNVESHIWRGYEYSQVLKTLWPRYKKFSWETLDKECTYTVRFQHPAYHPFDQPKIWTSESNLDEFNCGLTLIQCIHTATRAVKEADIGIPNQQEVKLTMDWQTLQIACNRSLEYFLCGVAGKPVSPLAIRQHKYMNPNVPVLFGYILRMDDRNHPNSDVIIESRLWHEIKSLCYDPPQPASVGETAKPHYFRDIRYMILNDYIQSIVKNTFHQILPIYSEIYQFYDNVCWAITDIIYDNHAGTQKYQGRKDKEALKPIENYLRELARRLGEILVSQFKFRPIREADLPKPGTQKHGQQLKLMAEQREMVHKLICKNHRHLIMIYEALHGELPRHSMHPEYERARCPPVLITDRDQDKSGKIAVSISQEIPNEEDVARVKVVNSELKVISEPKIEKDAKVEIKVEAKPKAKRSSKK